MISLILDSATKYFYVSLVKDKKVLKELQIDGSNNHAPHSVDCINALLKEFNLKTSDLDEVICGIGPGSYTGVRIALTIAKMITCFHDITLKTISTLALMSSGYDEEVLVLIDARRGNYFSAIYKDNNEVLEEKLRNETDLPTNIKVVDINNFLVDSLVVLEKAKQESKKDEVVPNYLRITEAEYLKNDKKSNT